MDNKKRTIILLSLLALISIALYVFWGLNPKILRYSFYIRVPRLIAIVIAGSAIALSSMLFQGVTQNRIITPSIMGLDALYGLVQTVVVFLFGSTSIVFTSKPVNFVVNCSLMLILAMILFKLVLKDGKNNIFFLLLVGTVIGTLFRSISSFMQVIIDPNEYDALYAKINASFNLINKDILLIVLAVVLIIFALVYEEISKIEVISLGRDTAINLGVNYDKFTKKMLTFVSILVSVATALVGPITFLGILVVNLTHELTKSYKYNLLIPVSILISIIALVGGQFILERLLNFGGTISIIINFVGGLYFIRLLLKEGKVW